MLFNIELLFLLLFDVLADAGRVIVLLFCYFFIAFFGIYIYMQELLRFQLVFGKCIMLTEFLYFEYFKIYYLTLKDYFKLYKAPIKDFDNLLRFYYKIWRLFYTYYIHYFVFFL